MSQHPAKTGKVETLLRSEQNGLPFGTMLKHRSEAGVLKMPEIPVENRQKLPKLPGFCHRFVTTADAKIPLSVGQVKREPQYVVFCSP
jgi:hypothetical protein